MKIDMRKRFAAVGGALAVIVGAGVGLAPTASAWDSNTHVNQCGTFFTENCGHGGVGDNNWRVFAYDQRSDGDGFRTNYKMLNGQEGYIDDPDGNGGLSGQVWTPSQVSSYRVCSKQGSDPRFWPCSRWIRVL